MSAAPHPPPEFCLLWIDHWTTCMTKSEWSGWAQALGAIAALAITLFLWRRSESQEGRKAEKNLRTFAGSLATSLPKLLNAMETQSRDKVRLPLATLRRGLHVANALDASHLKRPEQQVALVMLTAVCQNIIEQCEEALKRKFLVLTPDERVEIELALGKARVSMQSAGLPTGRL